jgi:hypothetical protein
VPVDIKKQQKELSKKSETEEVISNGASIDHPHPVMN